MFDLSVISSWLYTFLFGPSGYQQCVVWWIPMLASALVSYYSQKTLSEEAERKLKEAQGESEEAAKKTRAELTAMVEKWPVSGMATEAKTDLEASLQKTIEDEATVMRKKILQQAAGAGIGESLITLGPEGKIGAIEKAKMEALVEGKRKISLEDAILRENKAEAKRQALYKIQSGYLTNLQSLALEKQRMDAESALGTSKLGSDLINQLVGAVGKYYGYKEGEKGNLPEQDMDSLTATGQSFLPTASLRLGTQYKPSRLKKILWGIPEGG